MAQNSIFVHIPKTAGQSLRHLLRDFSSIRDIEHGKLSEYTEKIQFEDYFIFGFVRNPYDRLVSSFYHLIDVPDCYSDDPNPFQRRRYSFRETFGKDINSFVSDNKVDKWSFSHFDPMHTFICDSDGTNLCNFVGRFETLQSSFDALCDKIELPHMRLPRFNLTGARPYFSNNARQIFSQENIQLINDRYILDFEYFDYEIQ